MKSKEEIEKTRRAWSRAVEESLDGFCLVIYNNRQSALEDITPRWIWTFGDELSLFKMILNLYVCGKLRVGFTIFRVVDGKFAHIPLTWDLWDSLRTGKLEETLEGKSLSDPRTSNIEYPWDKIIQAMADGFEEVVLDERFWENGLSWEKHPELWHKRLGNVQYSARELDPLKDRQMD